MTRTFTREEIASFITPGDNGIIATLARQLLAAMEQAERLEVDNLAGDGLLVPSEGEAP